MIVNPNFEITEIADEFIAVPVGSEIVAFNGIVALSEPAAYLLKQMKEPKSLEELVVLITEEYDVDKYTAEKDVKDIVEKLLEMGLVLN